MEFIREIFRKSLSPKSTTTLTWIYELKGMDDISAIEYSTQQLNADFQNNIFQNDRYLDAFLSIDEKTHTIVERITAHYINIDNISVELDERIANAVFLYHRQIFLIYLTLVENPAEFDDQTLLTMLARALNSATQMIKWRYYNYQSAPANVWLQISRLYQIAEKQLLFDSNVQFYENDHPTTLSAAYIQACMLGSLENLSLKSQQIDLVSSMLTKWAAKILIQKTYDEERHLFYVNTAINAPAKRIRNFKPADTNRYWCVDSINSKIALCISALELNISPKQLALEAFSHNKYFLPTLEILHSEWSRSNYKRQRRSEERIKTAKSATTAYGFKDTCYQIKQYENIQVQRGDKSYQGDKSFDERLASHFAVKERTEPNIIYVDLSAGYSNIVDESSKGIGLRISKQAKEVSLGMMVGVSVKAQKYGTRIGVIRCIKPVPGNELHIGVEVLSRTAFCIEAKNISRNTKQISAGMNNLHEANANVANNTPSFTCLVLPEEYGVSSVETLIVPKLQYNKNDVFMLNILGVNKTVQFTETLEDHDNWIRVAYSENKAK